ncbi:hypothetical protein FACS1894190_10620 [Spirochaetia bacterium]|nr:hypothetical protein FACS1894190_10620 [Spirochaetia bacterium]
MSGSLFEEEKLSHYQTLGVEKTAADDEIKRSYFSMVRKFQPGTNPEKFKQIRTAYETLKDKQKRAEYDAIGELPGAVAPLFNEAQWFDHLGRHGKAAELYRTILKRHPELDNVREQYAKSLMVDEKIGKAIEVWEELCRRNLSNVQYSEKLAECYLDRGWHKKFEVELKRTLTLDPSSLRAWSLTINGIVRKTRTAADPDTAFDEIKVVTLKAIKAVKDVKENEWEKIHLYTHAVITSPKEDVGVVAGYLDEIARIIRDGGRTAREEGMTSLLAIFNGIPSYRLCPFYNEVKKITDLLPELQKSNSIRVKIENIRINCEIENLMEKGFSKVLYDLFSLLASEFEEEDDEFEIAAMEFEILKNRNTYNPQIRRLREEFPEIYSLHSVFLNEALRTKDHEKMMYQRSKKVRKYQQRTDFIEEHPESAPVITVHRTEPKIGRNDPCPCGSGKKYKKCCGA